MGIFEFDLKEWFLGKVAKAMTAALTVYGRWSRYVAANREAQEKFNSDMDSAAAVLGIDNLGRMMDGKPPRLQPDVWSAPRKPVPAPKESTPWIYIYDPRPDSPRKMQEKFNRACEAYVAKYGIVALEEALKPEPTPVPVSDPKPPKRPPGKHYR